jgi:hypothetical protein
MVFKPTVLVAERDRELMWLGRSEGDVFNGEHRFLIGLIQNNIRFTSYKVKNLPGQWSNRLKLARYCSQAEF